MQFVFHLLSGERTCVAEQDVNVVGLLINWLLHNYIRKGEGKKIPFVGVSVSDYLSENCQVNTQWLKKQPPYTHPKQTLNTLRHWDPFCLYLEKLLSGFFCK